jgi:iron complex transport system ATP-binding protein
MTPRPSIEITDLTCRLGGVVALDGVTLTVNPAEVCGLIGPNGAGKTTLLRAIGGALAPGQGRVTVEGRAPDAISPAELARLVAVLPQRPVSPRGVTVREAVAWGRAPHLGRLARLGAHDLRVVDAVLARVSLTGLADRVLHDLSGGEHHRALIARALAQEPKILLLDEPTVHLDLGHQLEVMTLLRALADEGLTVVAALHDLNLAAMYCDRLALLHRGRLLASGTASEVLRPDLIAGAYGATVRVDVRPHNGRPYVVLDRPPPAVTTDAPDGVATRGPA